MWNATRCAMLVLAAGASSAPLQARQVEVRPGTGTPIATALASAQPFDTLVLLRGLYREPVIVIDKSVTVRGEPGAVLDGGGTHGLFLVRASHVRLQGLTLRNTGFSGIDDRAAIRVVDATDCAVVGNRLERAFFGIYLARVTGCEVRDNVISGTAGGEMDAGNGIHLWYSRNVQLVRNTIEHQRDGIYFEFTHGAVATGNTSRENHRYGLHFMFSDSCRYVGNRFERNGAGIAVMYTNHVEIRENLFADSHGSASYGLLLKSISDSRIEHNTFRSNSVGLHLEDANRNQVIGNRMERNGWALRLMASADDNTVARNDFTGNAFDVVATGDHNTTHMRGNYWDAYRGYDLDRNGTGDVPHHPVRFFALIVANNPPALVLLRSVLLDLLDVAERVLPVLTPASVVDVAPSMRAHT